MPEKLPDLQVIIRARAFLGLTLEESRKALGGNVIPVPGDEYVRMRDVTSLEDPRAFPGILYLENNGVELVRLNPGGLIGYTRGNLQAYLSGPPVLLRSRAGKKDNLLLYPEQGIAFSAQGDILHFMEVFTPCTQKEYESRIYKKPAAFIR